MVLVAFGLWAVTSRDMPDTQRGGGMVAMAPESTTLRELTGSDVIRRNEAAQKSALESSDRLLADADVGYRSDELDNAHPDANRARNSLTLEELKQLEQLGYVGDAAEQPVEMPDHWEVRPGRLAGAAG